nr:LysR family transcriptional regulator [uncultured Oscillibacter sp.]
MNTIKCQIFLKAVELGSITRAAEDMGYTQSAVSRSIADLEREWNVTLLTRNKDGVVLTTQGESLLPDIQALCNAQRTLETQVSALHGLTSGTLRVGTFTSVSIHWLPGIMKEFLALYPGIRFQLVSRWEFTEVEELVRRGLVDCGFLGLPAGDSLDISFLQRDRLLAVLPPDHPLAGAPYYPMARLTQDPFILIQENWDMEISRIFQEEGLRPNVQYTLSDDFAILAMVEQGLGVSILSEMLVRSTSRHVAAIPLERPRYREIGLAVRRGGPIPPLTRRFRDFTLQWLENTP